MEIIFSSQALQDKEFWKKSGNKQVQKKIEALIVNIQNQPTTGIGQPGPLKHQLTGLWSRRINKEHRLVYEVMEDVIEITSMYGHY